MRCRYKYPTHYQCPSESHKKVEEFELCYHHARVVIIRMKAEVFKESEEIVAGKEN